MNVVTNDTLNIVRFFFLVSNKPVGLLDYSSYLIANHVFWYLKNIYWLKVFFFIEGMLRLVLA